MNGFDQIIERIEALPAEGDGMLVAEIADAVAADTDTVISALEEIVEREEREGSER